MVHMNTALLQDELLDAGDRGAVGREWMPVASSDGGYALLSAAHTA